MKASKCVWAAWRFILSTSKPCPSGDAGAFLVPVGVMPVRRMIHSPAGTSQRSVPSAASRSLRSTTSPGGTASCGASGSACCGHRYVSHIGSGVGCILPSCFSTNRSNRAAPDNSISAKPPWPRTFVSVRRNRLECTGGKETATGPYGMGPTLISTFERSSGNERME